jgi:hypothetical protein
MANPFTRQAGASQNHDGGFGYMLAAAQGSSVEEDALTTET